MALNEPILVNEFSSLARMGPFMLIGSVLHGRRWAHSSLSAVSSWTAMGPLMLIGSFLHWPEWAHSCSSAVFFMGPFTLISGFLHGRQWAHSSLSAVASWTGVGPLMLLHLDFTTYADTSDCIVPFSFLPTPKPMYNMILHLFYVRYDLTSCSCTIWSLGSFVYDINL